MKIIILFFTTTILLVSTTFAIDQTSINNLKKQGLQIQMGELTGAGSKFSVHNLAGFILPEAILMKDDCGTITVKTSSNPLVSDIVKIKIQDQEIAASEFIGFIVK